jgi:hypothetical protein
MVKFPLLLLLGALSFAARNVSERCTASAASSGGDESSFTIFVN